MTTTDLANRLEDRAAAPAQRGATVFDLIERQKPQIALALPAHIGTERFTRIAVTELRRNPRLQACNPMSLLGALMQSAQLGLEPGPLQEAYLVPFGNEITFIVGYRGLMKLIRQSDEVASLVAREVYEGDTFEFWSDEDGDHFKHVPNLQGDRGQVYAYYGVARFKAGGQLVHVMTQADVDRHRKRSRSGDSGPWKTDPIAMGLKTVIRAMSRWLPLSTEVASALEADDRSYEWRPGAGPMSIDEPPALPEPEAPAALPAPSEYDSWSKDQLTEACRSRGLAVSGTKADLAQRLVDHDAAQPAEVEIVEDAAPSSAGGEAVDGGPSPVPAPAGEPEPSSPLRDGAGQHEEVPPGLPDDWPASPATSPADSTVGDDPAFWSAERWGSEVDARGVNRNTVLRQARALAQELDVEAPGEFGAWTDPVLSARLADWLNGTAAA